MEIHIMPAVFLGTDAAYGEDDIASIFIHGIEVDERICVVEVPIFIVPQAAKHGPRFHIVPIQDIRVRAGLDSDGGFQEDRAVYVILARSIMVK